MRRPKRRSKTVESGLDRTMREGVKQSRRETLSPFGLVGEIQAAEKRHAAGTKKSMVTGEGGKGWFEQKRSWAKIEASPVPGLPKPFFQQLRKTWDPDSPT